MFDFEKLDIYQHLKRLSIDILKFCADDPSNNLFYKDQLKEAVLKALFNLAESTARMNSGEKKKYLVNSRSAVFESVAILQIIDGMTGISLEKYEDFYDKLTSASKMLLAMYRSYDRN
jgi:four helix bundle protein